MIISVFSLFAVIHLTSSLTVEIPQATYEFARGDDGIIPCNFKTTNANPPLVTIAWTAHPDVTADPDINILTYFYSATGNIPPDISDDRASIQVDIAKGTSVLTIKSLTPKDTRIFQCTVTIPGDIGKPDTTSVVVLVAPSKPICNIQGTAEYYQNINLTCHSEEGTPTPTYKWQSYDVNNQPRPNPPKATDVNGILSLYNISMDTSGYYICTSANKIRSSSCNVTLSVMPYTMKIGSTAIIVGAVLGGLILLIIIICCCCRRRRQKKEAERIAMGYTGEDQYTDEDPRKLEEPQDRCLESKAGAPDGDRRDDDDRQARPDNKPYGDDRRSDRYDDRRSDRYDDRRSDRYDDRKSDRYDDRRNDRYDDRRSDYDDRRSDYDDRRSDYDDRRSDYDDRRSDYDDRRSDRYDDRRRDRYDDRRDRYDHPDDRYDDRRDRYDRPDDRYDDRRDRYDHPDDRYDDRRDRYDRPDDHSDDRSRPPNVPPNKPTRG